MGLWIFPPTIEKIFLPILPKAARWCIINIVVILMYLWEVLHVNNSNQNPNQSTRQAYASTAPDASEQAQFDHLLDLMVSHSSDPIEELAGYLVTEDPTYLPEDTEAKTLIRQLGRDKLLRMMLSRILNAHTSADKQS